MGWGIVIGTAPIAVLGVLFKNKIETDARQLTLIAIALIRHGHRPRDRRAHRPQEAPDRVADRHLRAPHSATRSPRTVGRRLGGDVPRLSTP